MNIETLLYLFFVTGFGDCRKQTRILMNDYDAIQTVQNLVKKYNDLENALKQSNATIQTLTKQNQDLIKKYNALEANTNATIQPLVKQNQDLARKYSILETKYKTLAAKTNGGAIFVHWGKPTCPGNDSVLVYAGYLGGSDFSAKGAATTHLCLSPDPQWGNMPSLSPTLINVMYGSELDGDYAGPNSGPQDNTCAVCKSQIHSTALMIPGRHECYPGWKKQYSGNLMTSPVGYSPKEIICLNDHPEFTVGGGAKGYGNLLYPIKAVCGSLECPPYVNNKLLTCVVCTQ